MNTLSNTLKGELQPPTWITSKQLDANRFLFVSTVRTDLSERREGFTGYRVHSGQNFTKLFFQAIEYQKGNITGLSSLYLKRHAFPLGTPYGPQRATFTLNDSLVGCNFLWPGQEYMKKMNAIVQPTFGNATSNTDTTQVDNIGVHTRVLSAKHRFSFTNFGRHPIQILGIYEGQNTSTTPNPELASNTTFVSEIQKIPNSQSWIIPGGQAGADGGVTSFIDIPFNPKDLNPEAFKLGVVDGPISQGGTWRKVNNEPSTDANSPWAPNNFAGDESTYYTGAAPWLDSGMEGMDADNESDSYRGAAAGFVRLYARQMIPNANMEAVAGTDADDAYGPLGDTYRMLNVSVSSQFVSEVVKTETKPSDFFWNPNRAGYVTVSASVAVPSKEPEGN